MFAKKHSEEFLRVFDIEGNKGQVLKNIIETEDEMGRNLLDWEDTEVALFLRKANSMSPLGLNKNMNTLRKFANFICKKEKLAKRTYKMEDGVFLQLIDRTKLMSVTLNYEQYLCVREQLDITEDGMKINLRDKVIFELAWEGLTNDEIKSLTIQNIEFVKSEYGWDDTILSLKNKIVRVGDPKTTEDIKMCLKETYCIKTAKDERTKKTYYKDSEYLIKPVNVGAGATSNKTYLNNPHLALQRVLRNGKIVCNGIDVEKLTLTDIRRSRLIYFLSPDNEEFFNFKSIAGIYNLKRPEALRWYKEVALEKYADIII